MRFKTITDKLYYTIQEVSEMVDVPTSTLRFWQDQFDLLNPSRTKKNHRKYTTQDIEVIKLIQYFLEERKMKIEGAKPYITKHMLSAMQQRVNLIDKLKAVREGLSEISNSL